MTSLEVQDNGTSPPLGLLIWSDLSTCVDAMRKTGAILELSKDCHEGDFYVLCNLRELTRRESLNWSMSEMAIFRQLEKMIKAGRDYVEIGHSRWFSVVLRVSEQFLSSFRSSDLSQST
jgi:hypothetical protein